MELNETILFKSSLKSDGKFSNSIVFGLETCRQHRYILYNYLSQMVHSLTLDDFTPRTLRDSLCNICKQLLPILCDRDALF